MTTFERIDARFVRGIRDVEGMLWLNLTLLPFVMGLNLPHILALCWIERERLLWRGFFARLTAIMLVLLAGLFSVIIFQRVFLSDHFGSASLAYLVLFTTYVLTMAREAAHRFNLLAPDTFARHSRLSRVRILALPVMVFLGLVAYGLGFHSSYFSLFSGSYIRALVYVAVVVAVIVFVVLAFSGARLGRAFISAFLLPLCLGFALMTPFSSAMESAFSAARTESHLQQQLMRATPLHTRPKASALPAPSDIANVETIAMAGAMLEIQGDFNGAAAYFQELERRVARSSDGANHADRYGSLYFTGLYHVMDLSDQRLVQRLVSFASAPGGDVQITGRTLQRILSDQLAFHQAVFPSGGNSASNMEAATEYARSVGSNGAIILSSYRALINHYEMNVGQEAASIAAQLEAEYAELKAEQLRRYFPSGVEGTDARRWSDLFVSIPGVAMGQNAGPLFDIRRQ